MTRPSVPSSASPPPSPAVARAGEGVIGGTEARWGEGFGALRRVVALGGGGRMSWRLAGAALLGAATEACGVALMATATWLLVTAAGQPPLAALTVAIVVVRALAIGRGALRYTERLAGHDAVLRIVTEVRARIFERLIDRPLARNADALSRMVSDVDAVQDLVVRVALPLFGSGLVLLVAAAVTGAFAPQAGLVLLAGLLITGVVIPALGARLTTSSAARLAPLRAAYAVCTVDLVHGAADLAAFERPRGTRRRARRRRPNCPLWSDGWPAALSRSTRSAASSPASPRQRCWSWHNGTAFSRCG
jgi:ABC-type multidrug transport system fused ATPase/permease subunit